MTAVDLAPGFTPGAMSPLAVAEAARDLRENATADHLRFGTGWSIDDICGTPGVGELALMWARSSAGKSTWYLNVIRNTPEVPTLVVNMEMTPRRQVEWLLSMTFDLQTAGREIEEVLRWGDDDPRYGEIVASLDQLSEVYPHLHFVTPSSPTVNDLDIMVNDVADATGVKPVRMVIDHVGLMAGADSYQGYDAVIGGLHSLSLQEGMSVIAMQQVGRGGGDAGGRNDGHMPITLSSGTYTGEQHADFVYGLYRPERNPKFKKDRHQFDDPEDWYKLQDELNAIRGVSILQVVKNRPFGDLCEDGIELRFSPHTRRLSELGATHGY